MSGRDHPGDLARFATAPFDAEQLLDYLTGPAGQATYAPARIHPQPEGWRT